MKKIAIILPYFGESFPNYFPYFLKSCSDNHTIDFLIYTNIDIESILENIKVIKCTFSEFSQRVQSAYDFKLALTSPYKLCDFKPAYGEILAEDLKEYDYWGHCDCDMIFGDIRHFVTDNVLESHERVYSRGHLSIYKNTDNVNSFYRTFPGSPYREVFSSPKSFAFDEWGSGGTSNAWVRSGLPFYDELDMDDILTGYSGFHVTKEFSDSIGPYKYGRNEAKRYSGMKYVYYAHREGKLFREYIINNNFYEEEVIYAHFSKRKLYAPLRDYPSDFVIIADKFQSCRSFSSRELKEIYGKADPFMNKFLRLKRRMYVLYRKYT